MLHALVAVVHEPVGAVTCSGGVPQPHLQGVEGQVGAQAARQLPTHHPAGEHVDDERGVDPPGERADVGDVSDPQLPRAGRDDRWRRRR